jgi:hypothetical protein
LTYNDVKKGFAFGAVGDQGFNGIAKLDMGGESIASNANDFGILYFFSEVERHNDYVVRFGRLTLQGI